MVDRPLKIVLLGGGHSNIQVLKIIHDNFYKLHPHRLQLTMISAGDTAFYSGMLPGAIAGLYSEEEITIPLRPLAYACACRMVSLPAVSVDSVQKSILLSDGSREEFDILAVDIGSRTRGIESTPGVKQFTLATRPLNVFFNSVAEAESSFSRDSPKRIVIVGGGVAGVELCFSFIRRWAASVDLQVTLLHSGAKLLTGVSEAVRQVAMQRLKDKHVSALLNKSVSEIRHNEIVMCDGTSVHADFIIWATGAEAHGLDLGGIEKCDAGFIKVNDFLQSVSHPEVFAAGDCITMANQRPGFPPKAGVYAVREGPVMARNIITYASTLLFGTEASMEPYVPQTDFLMLLNTGDGRSIGGKFGLVFSGKWVWNLKDSIDRSFMKLYSPQQLLGSRGWAKYQERQGEPQYAEEIYAACEPPPIDYSQQFGQSKEDRQHDLEAQVNEMSPEEGFQALVEASDLHGGQDKDDFSVSFQVIKRMGVDSAFTEGVISASLGRA
jgi:selenide,water dikinase